MLTSGVPLPLPQLPLEADMVLICAWQAELWEVPPFPVSLVQRQETSLADFSLQQQLLKAAAPRNLQPSRSLELK